MSLDYYLVCDKCKERSDNELLGCSLLYGGHVDKEGVYEFLAEHFIKRACAVEGIRIVPYESEEYETYNTKDEVLPSE